MPIVNKLISISEVVSALQYDYDIYLLKRLTDTRSHRTNMSTVIDHYTVVNALIDELLDESSDVSVGRRVVNTLTDQGVDITYATDMAINGLKRLVSDIGNSIPGITFEQLKGGQVGLCNTSDLHVSYTVSEE